MANAGRFAVAFLADTIVNGMFGIHIRNWGYSLFGCRLFAANCRTRVGQYAMID